MRQLHDKWYAYSSFERTRAFAYSAQLWRAMKRCDEKKRGPDQPGPGESK